MTPVSSILSASGYQVFFRVNAVIYLQLGETKHPAFAATTPFLFLSSFHAATAARPRLVATTALRSDHQEPLRQLRAPRPAPVAVASRLPRLALDACRMFCPLVCAVLVVTPLVRAESLVLVSIKSRSPEMRRRFEGARPASW